MKILLLLLLLTVSNVLFAQTPFNISVSNPVAREVLMGNYDPSLYLSSGPEFGIDRIICDIQKGISADSLAASLLDLESFHNRNTYSDTSSADTGIGAARRWAHSRFEQFSTASESRLLVSYLDFQVNVLGTCGAGFFRNVFAVLPGTDTSDRSIILIEAHMDSRCENVCDINCLAAGTEDNGSGTALVMELARVMSGKQFDHTLVFMLTVGEEQGLYGAEAFALYAVNNGIEIKAVQNNDIVGGIICGATSSPPSCPAENHIDSTQLRVFSFGNTGSPHKMFARSIKMMYEEKLKPLSEVPMTISLMIPEDRTGRGGDHIPFRQQGYTSIRFTAANEHGDANVTAPGYTDRQHTSRDLLGVDTDSNGTIDSFFVDLNYLKRNTAINGITAAVLALGPEAPLFNATSGATGILVEINDPKQYDHYRVGVREGTNNPDFIAVYTLRDTHQFIIPNLLAGLNYRLSVAAVDSNGLMSMFIDETNVSNQANTFGLTYDTIEYNPCECPLVGVPEIGEIYTDGKQIILDQNIPNPFSRETVIPIRVGKQVKKSRGLIILHDLSGKNIYRKPVILKPGLIKVNLDLHQVPPGIYAYSLYIDGILWGTKRLVSN